MHHRRIYLLAATAFTAAGIACTATLNPQPLPPEATAGGDSGPVVLFDAGQAAAPGPRNPEGADAGGADSLADAAALPPSPEADAGPPSCEPALPATYKPAFVAPTAATACSAADLDGYFDVCVDPLDKVACKTWREAHLDCTSCLEPGDGSGPIQQHLQRYYQTFNVAGCLSLERNETAPGTCSVAYAHAVDCQRDACAACSAPYTFPDLVACQKDAKATACAGYQTKFSTACGSTYDDPGGAAYACFTHPTDKNKGGALCSASAGKPCRDHYHRALAIFCGP